MRKRLLSFILLFVPLVFFPFLTTKVYADILFSDDFETGNLLKWEIIHGNWTISEFLGSKWAGANVSPFSDYEMQVGDFDWSDYEFSVDLLPKSGIDKNIFFRVENQRSSGLPGHDLPVGYGLHLTTTLLELQKWTLTSGSVIASRSVDFPMNSVSKITTRVQGQNIKIFVGNSTIPAIEYNDGENPIVSGRVALAMITGNSGSEVWYDNVLVTDLAPTPSPSPTPTPTPIPLPRLVLLPGLGASWNREKILFGTEVPQSAWKIPQWFPHYNNLIEALENAGYQKNEDLFIFAYDWTKPVDLIADDLKNYIDNVVDPPPGEKINIVGHSLGGLVGRAYIQENPGSHKVNKLITLGSPHKGVPQVYKAWEGADLHDLMAQPWRLLAELLLAVRGRNYQDEVVAIRNLAPVIRDLLPVFDYLMWEKNDQVISEGSLPENSRNLWLRSMGNPRGPLNLFSTVVGIIGDAPRWLRLVPRNKIDEALGRYPIGKPVGQENDMGDRAVLASSAYLPVAKTVFLSLDHSDLVHSQEGIDKILELLGIEGTSLATAQITTEAQSLVFALTSLNNLKVTDPNGAIFTPVEDNIIVIPNPLAGNYKVEVTGQNPGSYRLLTGQLTDEQDIWSEYQGTTAPGETDTYNIPIDNTLATTPSYLLKLVNEKLSKLIKEIDTYNIDLITKIKIKSELIKISAGLKPIPILLQLGKSERADRFIQKAITTNANLLRLAEENGVTSLLPPLRELQDLLGQLHDLL